MTKIISFADTSNYDTELYQKYATYCDQDEYFGSQTSDDYEPYSVEYNRILDS